ncbi:MAG: hypothetical protein ACRBBK_11485 [Paracoccaceae bacterium]
MLGILVLSIGVALIATLSLILIGAPLWAALICYAGIGAGALLIAGLWKAKSAGWAQQDLSQSSDQIPKHAPKS